MQCCFQNNLQHSSNIDKGGRKRATLIGKEGEGGGGHEKWIEINNIIIGGPNRIQSLMTSSRRYGLFKGNKQFLPVHQS